MRSADGDGTYRIIDSDAHILEPGDLFDAAVGRGHSPVDLPGSTPVLLSGRTSAIRELLLKNFAPSALLRCMDDEGIDGTVLYPSLGLWAPFQPEVDAHASAAACRRYNDWIAEYCDAAPDRLVAAGLVPTCDPDAAALEAERIASLGLVAVLMRPNRLYGRNPGDPAYDGLYRVLEDRGLPLAVHEGLGLRSETVGASRFVEFPVRHACSHPMEQMCAFASMVFDGALSRHPRLRVAFLEAGTGWLPYWLERLDHHWELDGGTERGAGLRPSDYFRRQCFVSADPEETLLLAMRERGLLERMMFASDFPHPEALYPHAADEMVGQLRRIDSSPTEMSAVLSGAAMQLYLFEQRLSGVSEIAPSRVADDQPCLERHKGAHRREAVDAPVEFLSSEWCQLTMKLTVEHFGEPGGVSDLAAVNLAVSRRNGAALPITLASDGVGFWCRPGHQDDIESTVELSEEIARMLLLCGDDKAAVEAFAQGRLVVTGGLGPLLVLHQIIAGEETVPFIKEVANHTLGV
jgi:predicted TIM-barrel fold metal-dependent hydrolase